MINPKALRLDNPQALIQFVRDRADESETVAKSQHDLGRAIRRVEATRYLLARFERKLKSYDRHLAARAQFRADIAHQEETGVWAADYDRNVWSHSLSREEDYLVPMVSHFEALVQYEAAVYSDHKDYLPEWRPTS